MRRSRTLLLALGIVLAATSGRAASPGMTSEDCLACHGEPDLSLSLADGSSVSLHVDAAALAGSVHAGLDCVDCHPSTAEVPHPERAFGTEAEFRAGFREACKSCHFDNYTKTLDSVHFPLLSRGDGYAPTCVSCHGSHAIHPPGRPRARISQTCAECHAGISRTYASSVHGRALIDDDNPDVPVCTDCHRSHDIVDPGRRHYASHELCARCHADPKRMAKYGLSTQVVETYLADFHGVTASFSEADATTGGRVSAECVDCHGVHDIAAVDDASSPVLRKNLVETCRRCHPGASETFPAAWLSHYEPTFDRAPLVYLVNAFYAVFIPFVIGGLVLQILLHLWRVVVNR